MISFMNQIVLLQRQAIFKLRFLRFMYVDIRLMRFLRLSPIRNTQVRPLEAEKQLIEKLKWVVCCQSPIQLLLSIVMQLVSALKT